MNDELEERLRQHADAFDGLLSLIPPKLYYGEEGREEQWNRKKQTKEEAQRAKKAKLDPDSLLSSVDIRRQKANAESGKAEDGEDGEENEEPIVLSKKQLKKLKRQLREANGEVPQPNPKKKAKVTHEGNADTGADIIAEKKEEKNKVTPKQSGKQKKEGSSSPVKQNTTITASGPAKSKKDRKEKKELSNGAPSETVEESGGHEAASSDEWESDDGSEPEAAKESKTQQAKPSVTSDVSNEKPAPANTESIESPADGKNSSDAPAEKKPSNYTDVRARLQAKIEAFRAKRKADNPDGKPARTRQELVEQRKKKEEARKERKRLMRLKQKAEEEEAKKKMLEEGNSRSSPAQEEETSNNYCFGKVLFDDGTVGGTSGVKETKKRKGPSDPYTALKHHEAKKARIQSMPEEKKQTIEEKELWSKAIKQASGEKVRDDEKLLKKSLKRMEQKKRKSEREWAERKEGVAKSIENRQKKREENLAARRDSKKSNKKGAKKPAPKKKNRPGFEGGFVGKKSKK